MKISKKQKFSLEKFEVVKLSNIHLIKGGDGGDEPTVDTGTYTKTQSTQMCKPIPKPDDTIVK
jgi:hypothetical protein